MKQDSGLSISFSGLISRVFCLSRTVLSCVWLFATPWTIVVRLLCPWSFPGKNTGVGCHFLLQGIFWAQGSSPVSLASPLIDKQILYHCTTWEPQPLQKKFLSIWKRMTKGGPGLKSVYCRSIQCQFSSVAQSCPIHASGGQNIGVSASTSVLPMNTQDWSPLGWTGWISLQSKGLSVLQSPRNLKASCCFRIKSQVLSPPTRPCRAWAPPAGPSSSCWPALLGPEIQPTGLTAVLGP